MRRLAFALPLLAIPALVLAVFGRLAADPTALLVDGARPSIDEQIAADERSIGNDRTRLFLPHHLRIAERVARHGRPPAWDPAGFGGRPLVGNPQAGLWYPPVWLLWWSGAPAVLGWLTVGHLILGGLGTFALGRSLRLGRFASWVAAGCFALSPYVLAQVGEGHDPHVWAACWYPWVLLAFLHWRRSRDLRAALAVAPLLALTALTGHPQEAYYLMLALGGWILIDAFRGMRRPSSGRGRAALGTLAVWGLVVVLSLGLAAVEFVPVLAAQEWTLRSDRLSLSGAGRYHIEPLNLLQLLSPRALGGPADYHGHGNYWETLLSMGWVPLVLAVLAVVRWPVRADVRPWLVLAVVTIVFAAGRRLGLFALLYHVAPGMDRFRVPARALFLFSLAAAILAGYGVEALRRGALRLDASTLWRRYRRLMIGITGAIGVGCLLLKLGEPQRDVEWPGEIARLLATSGRLASDPVFWLALAGGGLALAWLSWRPREDHKVGVALGLLALVELGLYGFAGVRVAPAEQFLGPDPVAENLNRFRGPGPVRIRARDATYPDLRAIVGDLEKTNLNDSFQLQHAEALYSTLYPLFDPPWPRERDDPALARKNQAIRRAVLDRLGVAFLVTDHPPVDPLAWPVAAGVPWQGRLYWLYRNPAPLPRAYVVPRAEPCPDALAVAAFPFVSPREAVLMPADPLGVPDGARQPFTPAVYDASSPDRVIVRVETEAPGLLVCADTWMPGWTARVNGHPAPVLRGDRAWRVVPLPAPGRHEIILSYRAPGLVLGICLSGMSALVWLLALAQSTRSRRLKEPGAGAGLLSRRQLGRITESATNATTWRRGVRPSRDVCGGTTRY